MNNARNGKALELMVEQEAQEFAPDLVVKRIERNQYESTYDLEFLDFPEYRVDCKSTIGTFSFNDLKKLLETCKKKYCQTGGIPVIIYGQRKGKSRITRDDIGVAMGHRNYGVVCVPLRAWLKALNSRVN